MLPAKRSKDNTSLWCLPQTFQYLSQYFAQMLGQVVFKEELSLPLGVPMTPYLWWGGL